ncbi:MAG: hypothetical protein FJ315_01900 [SAR202 cluster bacterium]|nr:hypothetical protein [SAR202 cluster bacterium]
MSDHHDTPPRTSTTTRTSSKKAHRTLVTLINGLLDAGLAVERVIEPVPSDQWFPTTLMHWTNAAAPCSSSSAPASPGEPRPESRPALSF